MKILFLTHSFNSLAQRLYIELARRGHDPLLQAHGYNSQISSNQRLLE